MNVQDWVGAGLIPMRDHNERAVGRFRNVPMACRTKSPNVRGFSPWPGRDRFGAPWAETLDLGGDEDTQGDLNCGNFWPADPDSKDPRDIGGWTWGPWASEISTPAPDQEDQGPSDGPVDASTNPFTGTVSRAPGFGPTTTAKPVNKTLPIRKVEWNRDTRFKERPAALPAMISALPKSWPGTVVSGTEETSQENLFIPAGGMLCAPYHAGWAALGTLVFDTTEDGDLDTKRKAPIQSSVRVYETPRWTGASFGAPGKHGLSIQCGTPVRDFPGLGMFSDDAAAIPATPARSVAHYASSTDGKYGVVTVSTVPATVGVEPKTRPNGTKSQTISPLSYRASGPLHPGFGARDPHYLGSNTDGDEFSSGGIDTDAYFVRNVNQTGPLEFGGPYRDGEDGPVVMKVHLGWDPIPLHTHVNGPRNGMWRWWTTSFFNTPPPPVVETGPIRTGTVETGPIETGSVHTGTIMTGPIETGSVRTGSVETGTVHTGTIETGGGGRITQNPPHDDDLYGPQPRDEGYLVHGKVPPNRHRDYNEGGSMDAPPPVGSFKTPTGLTSGDVPTEVIHTGSGAAAGPVDFDPTAIINEILDELVKKAYDETWGRSAKTATGQGADQTFRENQIGKNYLHTWLELVAPSVGFRAQNYSLLGKDFRNNRKPTGEDLLALDLTAPRIADLIAIGNQKSDSWTYQNKPGASRAPSGDATGTVWFTPAGIDVTQILDGKVPAWASGLNLANLGIYDRCSLVFGTPLPNGGVANGTILRQTSPGNVTSYYTDSTGTVTGSDTIAPPTAGGGVPNGRTITTTSPIRIGGGASADLSADRTIALANQTANTVLSGPTSGGSAAPDFRALVAADIPNLDAAKITTGTLAVARGGTNLGSYTTGDLLYASGATTIAKLAAGTSGYVLTANGAGVAPSYQAATSSGGVASFAGDGSDGAADLDGANTYSWATKVGNDYYNTLGDLALSSLTIRAGCKLYTGARILVQGNCTIEATALLDTGSDASGASQVNTIGVGATWGYGGGASTTNSLGGAGGAGANAAGTATVPGGGGGKLFRALPYAATGYIVSRVQASFSNFPVNGGAAGGGNGFPFDGGAGGGCLILIVGGDLNNAGTISAKGGAAGAHNTIGGNQGGGGGGLVVVIHKSSITAAGTISAPGGAGTGGGANGSAGTAIVISM